MSKSTVYTLATATRPRRKRVRGLPVVAAVVVLGASAGFVSLDAMTPAAHHRPAAVAVAHARHDQAPAPAGATQAAAAKAAKHHPLRALMLLHRLVHHGFHRRFFTIRRIWRWFG